MGMAPMSGFEQSPVAPLWSRAGRLLCGYGTPLYAFQGLRAFKNKFDPVWESRYLCIRQAGATAHRGGRVRTGLGRLSPDLLQVVRLQAWSSSRQLRDTHHKFLKDGLAVCQIHRFVPVAPADAHSYAPLREGPTDPLSA